MQVVIDQVSFRYGLFGFRSFLALEQVNWVLKPGITGLIGPNGAGKTTLISLLVGAQYPSTGSITFVDSRGHREQRHRHRDGQRSRSHRVTSTVGYVPQHFSLVPSMSVFNTIAYAAWINGVDAKDCGQAALTALRLVEMEDQQNKKIKALSGGQRQRVGLATALAHQPQVMILDEPTVGLDPGQRLKFRELLVNIAEDRTVLLSTHLVEDVAQICNQVGVIADGQLVFSGEFKELAQRAASTSNNVKGIPLQGSQFERAYDDLINGLVGAQ